jgi:hypothetical protein
VRSLFILYNYGSQINLIKNIILIRMAKKDTSKHLDSDRKETKAMGERKNGGGTLMDGIIGGLAKRVNPPVVDGICRGISKDMNPGLGGQMSRVDPGATQQARGSFGSGAFAQGK